MININLNIWLIIIIGIILLIVFVNIVAYFFRVILTFNNLHTLMHRVLHVTEKDKFIAFEYNGEKCIGKVYDKNNDVNNPDFYIASLYLVTNSTQHIPLKDIKKYVLVKFVVDMANDKLFNQLKNDKLDTQK